MNTLFGDEMNVEKPTNKLLALQTSESEEWHTPAVYIEAARKLMNGIELDPASCAEANRIVRATKYYTKEQNGLARPWNARSLWLNPPYGRENGDSNQERWSGYLISQYESGNTKEAILLVNASTSTQWFQRLWAYPVCFTDHKIRFHSGQSSKSNQPTHGNAFVYLGPQEDRFISIFSQFGIVARCVSTKVAQPTLWDSIESEVSA